MRTDRHSTLGLVASRDRKIEPLGKWESYFDFSKLKQSDPIEMETATVFDTIRFMDKVVRTTLSDTKKLADALKGATVQETLQNNWNWLFDHIAYKEDKKGIEQVRRPLRLVYDRQGDCDCFTVFLSSLLINQGIEHSFRMAKYLDDWQHIYIIVPNVSNGLNAKAYTTLDCVLDGFDQEHTPIIDKHDHQMKLQYLNGLGEVKEILHLDNAQKLEEGLKRIVAFGETKQGAALKNFVNPLNEILFNWYNVDARIRAAKLNTQLYNHPFFSAIHEFLVADKRGESLANLGLKVIATNPIINLAIEAAKANGVQGLGSATGDYVKENPEVVSAFITALSNLGKDSSATTPSTTTTPPSYYNGGYTPPAAQNNTAIYVLLGMFGLAAVGGIAYAVSSSGNKKN